MLRNLRVLRAFVVNRPVLNFVPFAFFAAILLL